MGPDEYQESARRLEGIIRGAVRPVGAEQGPAERDAARNSPMLEAVMQELARCCSEVIAPPSGGADLGAILIGYQFKKVLAEHGLVVAPSEPTSGMEQSWKRGWL